MLRGLNNLAALYVVHGDLQRAEETVLELRELCTRYGQYGFLRFLEGGPGIGRAVTTGDWAVAMDNANRFLAGVEEGSPHYQAAAAYASRAAMRLACDDEDGAVSDAERALELAPIAGDPQLVLVALPDCALVFAELGDERRARAIFDDALAELQGVSHMGFGVVQACRFAWLARRFGREPELEAVFARERSLRSGWLRAGQAVLAGDLRRGADVLAEMGAAAEAAYLRLRAADQLVAEGRRAEADEQLHAALAFYRGVGATRYVREGEALLAASA